MIKQMILEVNLRVSNPTVLKFIDTIRNIQKGIDIFYVIGYYTSLKLTKKKRSGRQNITNCM